MKEININIEGYNVNGICVGCLNYNRAMFYHPLVKECFRLLGDIDVPDGLAVQVCWECLAYIKTAMRLKNRMLQSYEFLINYSLEHPFLESPQEFEPFASTRLDTTAPEITSYNEDEVLEEKTEDIKEEEEKFEFDIPIKEELPEDSHYDDFPSQEYITSEDEQLSKLKEDKTKKKKKVKKKHKKEQIVEEITDVKPKKEPVKHTARKLKNLPEDLVQLYTMTDDEMWTVRHSDLNSSEFQRLKYKCECCIIGFNTEKLMTDHLSGKHQPKGDSHECNICKAYFLTKDHLSSHKALHLSAFSCTLCEFKTTLKTRMMKHSGEHGSGAEHHTCHTCGASFSTKSKLSYHRGVCKQERPQCDCCGKVFANKMTLKYHLKILPQNKEDKPKDKLFIPCKGCDKIFHSKKSYRAHVVIHDGLTYPCPICGKLFQWKRNLARHTRNHRERASGSLHECRPCNKVFASRDCYNNHMRLSKRHVAEETYLHECNYCGKKFATKWCLTDHIDWDHLKRIKYQCGVCFKAFKTAKIMVAHVNNIHEGKKKDIDGDGEHLCDICGKSYKTVKRLKGHVWAMHTMRSTSKSFKCKLCPATFSWQTSIYKHMKMMHSPTKKNKVPRTTAIPTIPAVKKEDPYPVMTYFHQNITNNVNIVHLQPMG